MKTSFSLCLIVIIMILPISQLSTQYLKTSSKNTTLSNKIKIEKTVNLGNSEKIISINPIVTLYNFSEVELTFYSTVNDLKYLIIETTNYEKVISTAPPTIEASFSSLNKTILIINLQFSSIPSTLPLNLTFIGTNGKITLDEIETFDNRLTNLNVKWNKLIERTFTWHLLATQTWAEIKIFITIYIKSILDNEIENNNVQILFNWTKYCNNDIKLSSSKIATIDVSEKLPNNEILNYRLTEDPILEFTFKPDHDFFSTTINIKINIWIRMNLNSNLEFSIEDIPFLPEWIGIPLGIILIIIPLAGVTKRPKAKLIDQTIIKDKNLE